MAGGIPVPATVRMSTLDEISMFTTDEDVPLKEVLHRLYEKNNGKSAVDPKGDEQALWNALAEVLPDLDRDRIYTSDLRKLFAWYDLLVGSGDLAPEVEEKAGAEEKEAANKVKADKPVAKKNEKAAKAKTSGTTKKAGAGKTGRPKAQEHGRAQVRATRQLNRQATPSTRRRSHPDIRMPTPRAGGRMVRSLNLRLAYPHP